MRIAKEYDNAIDNIKRRLPQITMKLTDELDNDDRIMLNGYNYDRHGVISGYEYEDIYYFEHVVEKLELDDIDYVDQDYIIASFVCTARISAECTYYDYDNAVWDHEEKEYVFLDKHTNLERHKAIFPVRVVIDSDDNMAVKSLDFSVLLDENSRLKVEEVNYGQDASE